MKRDSKQEKIRVNNENSDEDDVPLLLRPLIVIYRSIPKLYLPRIRNFNFAFILFSALFLAAIRQFIFWKMLMYVGWPQYSKMTTDAASSLTSICHSIILCWYLSLCFFYLSTAKCRYVPSARMSTFPLWWQDSASALLEFCTGYMIFDSFFLIWDTTYYLKMEISEFDKLVLAHHVMTSLYMASTRFVNAGHLSAMILMLTGEITNPLMNGMFTTRFAIQLDCCNSSQMILIHSILEYGFAISYAIFRIFIGPACSLHLSWDLIFTKHGRSNVPIVLSVIWVIMVWAVIHGSIPFVQECIEMMQSGYGKLKYDEAYDFGERFRIQEIRRHVEL